MCSFVKLGQQHLPTRVMLRYGGERKGRVWHAVSIHEVPPLNLLKPSRAWLEHSHRLESYSKETDSERWPEPGCLASWQPVMRICYGPAHAFCLG